MDQFISAGDVAAALRPSRPVTLFRPHAAQRAAHWFVQNFPGSIFYAVKANPSDSVLQTLWDAGIKRFDVASIKEVAQVHALFPDAELAFMHPIKTPEAIKQAYFNHGVRIFSLDSHDELEKIMAATGHASDLTLCVRLSVANTHARLSLGSKFGVHEDAAPDLLFATRQCAERLGLCFHVGSQTMHPSAYRAAMELARRVITRAGVIIDVLDVGGGFPSSYPGMEPPPLSHFITEIAQVFETMPVLENCELWCEPGRALVAEASSILVRVDARKDNTLYLNDGTYGSLFDAGVPGWLYPVNWLPNDDRPLHDTQLEEFDFFGPTCDDMDYMAGPFIIPAEVAPGDYLELGQLGAYGAAMRTGFNGFDEHVTVIATDTPVASLYEEKPQIQIAKTRSEGI